ncbi:hypothetical protein PR202_gb25855 [Eleusine coracana subsp. coracana]|uniref:TF-B3 domain-containing protein n=1 Tax=Eleusine coracana subsp. coracana TaxID=191504 RepID=A0AAV5FQ28_ELECO|nr:hypothetical protein PR202_gb25855 [Eleusine coracana subsp. coracana]
MTAPGDVAARKHTPVLLPFSCDSLRIPDELAEEIGAAEAHVVLPFGKGKVRRVELGRDGDGAFLGRGWPEFADSCGVGAGWLLVLRHHGGGVLTVKMFDETCCLRVLRAATPAVEATTSSSATPRRPQFISVLPPDSMGKMQIPPKFVQSYIPKEHLNSHNAVVFGPFAKIGHIEIEMNLSDVSFAVLPAAKRRLETPASIQNCRRKNILLGIKRKSTIVRIPCEKPIGSEGSRTSLKKVSKKQSNFDIGPPAWIKKEINASTIENLFSLPLSFCEAIGIREPCMVTLKTEGSTVAWEVRVYPYPHFVHIRELSEDEEVVSIIGAKTCCAASALAHPLALLDYVAIYSAASSMVMLVSPSCFSPSTFTKSLRTQLRTQLPPAATALPDHRCSARSSARPPTAPSFTCCVDIPFCNQRLPVERCADDLVLRLTVEEKILQLGPGLGVPAYKWSEVLHGVANAGRGIHLDGLLCAVTSFPQVILITVSFNPHL